MDFVKFLQIFQDGNIFLLWLFLVASLICTVAMIIIMLIKGDERRRFIVGKAGIVSLIGGIAILIASSIWPLFFERQSPLSIEPNPFIYLGAISIIFNVSYLILKRKHR
ncbi:MAG: hypothetical protein ACOYKC_03550 [Anaerolineaceae bacterium]|jgi:multisubunit Na+/H+ antiporter MnhB subunit